MRVGEFCRNNDACEDGRIWAYQQHPLKSKAPMSEIFPLLLDAPDKSWYQWTVFNSGLLSDHQKSEFARWAALQVWDLIEVPEKEKALIKRYLETGDLSIRNAAAASAARFAASARDASAARFAASASRFAASDRAVAAARSASAATYAANAYAANAVASERDKQNLWLWDNYGNIFEEQ